MTFQTIKNDENNRGKKLSQELKNALRVIWLRMRDSNPRMPVPKTGALPLGHAPITDRSLPYLPPRHKRYPYFTLGFSCLVFLNGVLY